MKKIAGLILMMIGLSFGSGLLCEKYEPDWSSLEKRDTPSWYDEAKFGIFIHWGVYSVPAWGKRHSYAEWYWFNLNLPFSATRRHHNKVYGRDFPYQDFALMFKAENFKPEEWADLFYRAGARYVVLTSKHHDGYCLYPSRYSRNWNSMDVGPHRDLLGDLSKAVRARGLKMGYYYSFYEWYHPLYRTDVKKYVDTHMFPQFKELVENYKPSIIFADGEWEQTSRVWRSEEFLAWLFNESPVKDEVVVNDRWGMETRSRYGDYYTSEYGKTSAGKKLNMEHKWEENQGIGYSFGYNANEPEEDYKTSEQLIHMLVDIVSKGGNLLLDVGPTADGRIPEIMQERLLEMGEWLKLNGEAIYGTKRWRVSDEGKVRYTAKGDILYAISLGFPANKLILSAVEPTDDTEVSLIGFKGALKWKRDSKGLVIDLSEISAEDLPTKYAYVFKLKNVR